jgi:hypothetical protein
MIGAPSPVLALQDIKECVEDVIKGRQFGQSGGAIPEPSLRMGKLRITVGLGDQTAAPPVKPHPTMLAAHRRGGF